MFDIKLIEAFVQIVHAGSMTRAESLTGTPKATFSRQLSKLEKTLELELVRRDSRRLVLTEAGRGFFAHGERLLAEMNARVAAARTEAQELSDGIAGDISVLTDTHFSTTFMCRVTTLFLERHPNVKCRFDIAGRTSSPTMENVDCYIGTRPPPHPNLVAKQLGRLTFGLYASARYLERYGPPQSEWELTQHPALVLDEGDPNVVCRLHSEARSFDYGPRSVIRSNDYWVIKTFCLDGLGIAVLPDFFTAPEVESGMLVRVLPAWRPEPMRVFCAYQRQRFSGRKLRAFIDLTVECFQRIHGFHYYVGSRVDSVAGED